MAYKKTRSSNHSYTFHKRQDFTVGEENARIYLTSGQNYTLVVVSTDTQTIPNIVDIEDFDKVRF